MKDIQWLSNEELFGNTIQAIDSCTEDTVHKANSFIVELERRLRLAGFFDMSLEFYLRELDGRIVPVEGGFECRVSSVIFFGKTALEAAKAAYEWRSAKGSKAWVEQQIESALTYNRPNPLDSLI